MPLPAGSIASGRAIGEASAIPSRANEFAAGTTRSPLRGLQGRHPPVKRVSARPKGRPGGWKPRLKRHKVRLRGLPRHHPRARRASVKRHPGRGMPRSPRRSIRRQAVHRGRGGDSRAHGTRPHTAACSPRRRTSCSCCSEFIRPRRQRIGYLLWPHSLTSPPFAASRRQLAASVRQLAADSFSPRKLRGSFFRSPGNLFFAAAIYCGPRQRRDRRVTVTHVRDR